MSDLTPEEQRAVEAAVANWANFGNVSVEEAVEDRVRADGNGIETATSASYFACGYLAGDRDGFKRGVEAAMATICPCSLRTCVDLRAKIRALLAQEEQRG